MDILTIIAIAVAFFVLWHLLGYYFDKKAWNNGVCPVCKKGFWQSFDIASDGSVGYKCTHCGNSHWQNGHYNTKAQPCKK